MGTRCIKRIDGLRCSEDAINGSNYCKDHQPPPIIVDDPYRMLSGRSIISRREDNAETL